MVKDLKLCFQVSVNWDVDLGRDRTVRFHLVCEVQQTKDGVGMTMGGHVRRGNRFCKELP